MREIDYTKKFRKDLKREVKTDPRVESLLRSVLELLQAGKDLPAKLKDHPLQGDWISYRDCHLKPDLVLIYKVDDTTITLARIGSHSEIF